MRNLSMKKFGTPIGAAPGVAREKLGFAGVGTPSGRRTGRRGPTVGGGERARGCGRAGGGGGGGGGGRGCASGRASGRGGASARGGGDGHTLKLWSRVKHRASTEGCG